MKKYPLAGLDFIIDLNGNPYFIEANSLPGFYKEQLTDEKKFQIMQKLFGKKLIVLTPKAKKLTKRQINLMKSITTTFVAYTEDNPANGKINQIKDTKGATHRNGTLLVWYNMTKPLFNKKFKILNHPETCELIKNKIATAKIIEKEKIPTPKTFPISTIEDLKKILAQESLKEYVLKPVFGSKGDNISFHKSTDKIKIPNLTMLIQERIFQKKLYGRYWDLRALVVNGKYIGAIKRSSANPATNISKGGRINKAPLKLQKIIAPLAEKIVEIYEKNS